MVFLCFSRVKNLHTAPQSIKSQIKNKLQKNEIMHTSGEFMEHSIICLVFILRFA